MTCVLVKAICTILIIYFSLLFFILNMVKNFMKLPDILKSLIEIVLLKSGYSAPSVSLLATTSG